MERRLPRSPRWVRQDMNVCQDRNTTYTIVGSLNSCPCSTQILIRSPSTPACLSSLAVSLLIWLRRQSQISRGSTEYMSEVRACYSPACPPQSSSTPPSHQGTHPHRQSPLDGCFTPDHPAAPLSCTPAMHSIPQHPRCISVQQVTGGRNNAGSLALYASHARGI